MAQERSASSPQKLRFGLHIHIYVVVTVVLLCAAVFVSAGLFAYRDGNETAAWLAAASGLVVFGAFLGLVAKYCSSETLSYWDGIRLASHYASIGVGTFSFIFSLFCITASVVVTTFLTLFGVVTNNRPYAQRGYLKWLQVLSKCRMHQ
jgi:hypothetical protein